MPAIRTTAVLEDARHLRLQEPLTNAVGTVVNVIVMTSCEPPQPADREAKFDEAFGSYYREHPSEPRRSSDEWLAELREGET